MSGILSSIATNYAITSAILTAEILAIGGGGSGGAGGGGGGGYQYDASYVITNDTLYSVTVGTGGTGGGVSSQGTNGGSSIFGTITAVGGGAGGPNGANGTSGGSGGAGGLSGSATLTGGSGTQGNTGGGNAGYVGGTHPAGGGGGAGAIGGDATSNSVAGNGGVGLANSISGSSVYYAGGGGGGLYFVGGTGGTGGNGGGGAGSSGGAGTAGTANTGGGGGGAGGSQSGGNGGSGVVVISYVTGTMSATGGTITTSGGNTIHTFTSSGSFTVGTPPPTYATWNPIKSSTMMVLSNGNLTGTHNLAPTGWATMIANQGKSTGKWYWETTGGHSPSNSVVSGISNDTRDYTTSNSFLGISSDGYGFVAYDGTIRANGGTFVSGLTNYTTTDIMGWALDMDAGTLKIYKNNTLVYTITGLAGTWYPGLSADNQSPAAVLTANFGATAFTYSPPAGYNAGLYA